MTLVKGQTSQDTSMQSKVGIRVFDQHDTTPRVIGCLMFRHRVGLWAFTTLLAVGYISYDKFFHIFF